MWFLSRKNPKHAYLSAVETDPVSYFGGIVAFNSEVDYQAAIEINKSFLECIVAKSFSKRALLELKEKLRLITINERQIIRLLNQSLMVS